MAINIGPVLRRRREWARVTQQELVDHTRMERSASYISGLETGKSSPTVAELELLARYFRSSVVELIQEAEGEEARRAERTGSAPPEDDDRLQRLFGALDAEDQELALDFLDLLARRKARR